MPGPDELRQGAGPRAILGGASRPVWNFWRELAPRAFTGRSPSERVLRPGVQRRRCRDPSLSGLCEALSGLRRPGTWDLAAAPRPAPPSLRR